VTGSAGDTGRCGSKCSTSWKLVRLQTCLESFVDTSNQVLVYHRLFCFVFSSSAVLFLVWIICLCFHIC